MVHLTDQITVELDDSMGSDLSIVRAARVSVVGVEEADHSDQVLAGLINFLMKNRHGTPFEHTTLKFRVHAPIFVFREWHRHRIGWSYNEESARYKQLDPVFYLPNLDRNIVQTGKPGHYVYIRGTTDQYRYMTLKLTAIYHHSYQEYEHMLNNGIAREVARMVLPVGIYSSMYATCNVRSLMQFLSLRTEVESATFPSHPMYEIQIVAEQMEEAFASLFPITYEAFNKNGRVSP